MHVGEEDIVRSILILAIAAGLGACASETTRQAAIIQCQTVGISLGDPGFDLCTRSYVLQTNQGQLETAYHRTLNPTYEKRGLGHQWHGF